MRTFSEIFNSLFLPWITSFIPKYVKRVNLRKNLYSTIKNTAQSWCRTLIIKLGSEWKLDSEFKRAVILISLWCLKTRRDEPTRDLARATASKKKKGLNFDKLITIQVMFLAELQGSIGAPSFHVCFLFHCSHPCFLLASFSGPVPFQLSINNVYLGTNC